MRFFVTLTLLTFCAIQGLSQKITTPKRVIGKVKVIKFTPIKSAIKSRKNKLWKIHYYKIL